ncbi:hypothetical protein BT96DRAFT_986949 [Gymnopus androsaceus JB14]|uniref:Adenylate kinase n=1 Tax=Gymnopus androsaceus JB14 TaxID=1447944 RepID=A0A6A4I8Q8_9AGAR|nr:hypothetical protein BT96DRAFT_986949 [Gymnopus androsaceus JB14]
MAQVQTFPPLLGDTGRYKIRILGNSGMRASFTSTLGQKLATILDVPFLSLDSIFWKPGWIETPEQELRAKIQAFVHQNAERGWVIDGDFERKGGADIQQWATDVIWLDPPLLLYFPRLFCRTFLRLIGLRPPCSSGCPETISGIFFSKDSIILWCLSQHRPVIERNSARMKIWGLGVGSNPPEEQKMRRLGGWGAEVQTWLEKVEEFIRNK